MRSLQKFLEIGHLSFNILEWMFFKQPQDTELNLIYQKHNFDCGQTCLEMLGYKDIGDFPNGMSGRDMESISGIKFASEGNTTTFEQNYYEKPHILSCSHPNWKDEHWVVAFKDKVYCPSLGVFYLSQYLSKVRIRTGFVVNNKDLI